MINSSQADWFHLDVMDGVFVPNITFGFQIIKVVKSYATKPLDVHLMIAPADPYIEAFFEDLGTLRVEPAEHYPRATDYIDEMAALVKRLEAGGHTYHSGDSIYYRISTYPVTLPPLRERTADIAPLVQFLTEKICRKLGVGDGKAYLPDALRAVSCYHWPGNVRELKSAFEYALVACHNALIRPDHLPHAVTGGKPASSRARSVLFSSLTGSRSVSRSGTCAAMVCS